MVSVDEWISFCRLTPLLVIIILLGTASIQQHSCDNINIGLDSPYYRLSLDRNCVQSV